MSQKLRIGEIAYANLFPIFYTLKNSFDCSSYEFVPGVPSALNLRLRSGELDLSPSSSIEYLKNPRLYDIIKGHSISSTGPVGSIFLFSRFAVDRLGGRLVNVTSQSETSVALLKIILKEFNGVEADIRSESSPEASNPAAFLLIGDDALKAAGLRRTSNAFSAYSFVYDLGDVWYGYTGLPFVFALWTSRKDAASDSSGKSELLKAFRHDLDEAKGRALSDLETIAGRSPLLEFMPENEIIAYWSRLDYELSDAHIRGLKLFGLLAGCGGQG